MGDSQRPDVLDDIHPPGHPSTDANLMHRRLGYLISTAVLTLIVGAAVLGSTSVVDTFGVATGRVGDEGGGYALEVRYATVSRPGLATPFDIEVRRAGGFDGPVTVAVDRRYLRLWDANSMVPAPSSGTTMGDWVLWEWDPPEGELLHFTYDARIEPASQQGADGRVAVIDAGEPVAEVEFHTWVLP